MIAASVVIPTYNRAEALRRCLDALARQRVDGLTFEVIVVDDGSRRSAADALADLRPPYRLTVLRQPNAGPGAARNRGAQAAEGRYCIFLDDDVLPERDLVAAYVATQERCGGVVGVGRITTILPARADWFARASAASLDRNYANLDQGASIGWMQCYSGNLSVPRDALLARGGFLVDLPRCEDIELGFRLEQSGMRLQYVPDARASQHCSKRLSDLTRDLERAGEAAVVLARRDARMGDALLGRFAVGAGPRQRKLLRTALALGLPGGAGALLARAVWREAQSRRRQWFLHELCFWRGVRHALGPDRAAWGRLTHDVAHNAEHEIRHEITHAITHAITHDAVT
jgi:GT2 family glycosyltransferase